MNKPHKHAEVIKAWADGAVIQWQKENGDWVRIENPGWHDTRRYRVKPADPIPVYPKMEPRVCSDTTFVDDVLRNFVMSGGLAAYVEKHGVDGLKVQK